MSICVWIGLWTHLNCRCICMKYVEKKTRRTGKETSRHWNKVNASKVNLSFSYTHYSLLRVEWWSGQIYVSNVWFCWACSTAHTETQTHTHTHELTLNTNKHADLANDGFICVHDIDKIVNAAVNVDVF